jgi:hypothetical protein
MLILDTLPPSQRVIEENISVVKINRHRLSFKVCVFKYKIRGGFSVFRLNKLLIHAETRFNR